MNIERVKNILKAVGAMSDDSLVFWHPVTWITVVLYFICWMVYYIIFEGLFGFIAETFDTGFTWRVRR